MSAAPLLAGPSLAAPLAAVQAPAAQQDGARIESRVRGHNPDRAPRRIVTQPVPRPLPVTPTIAGPRSPVADPAIAFISVRECASDAATEGCTTRSRKTALGAPQILRAGDTGEDTGHPAD